MGDEKHIELISFNVQSEPLYIETRARSRESEGKRERKRGRKWQEGREGMQFIDLMRVHKGQRNPYFLPLLLVTDSRVCARLKGPPSFFFSFTGRERGRERGSFASVEQNLCCPLNWRDARRRNLAVVTLRKRACAGGPLSLAFSRSLSLFLSFLAHSITSAPIHTQGSCPCSWQHHSSFFHSARSFTPLTRRCSVCVSLFLLERVQLQVKITVISKVKHFSPINLTANQLFYLRLVCQITLQQITSVDSKCNTSAWLDCSAASDARWS